LLFRDTVTQAEGPYTVRPHYVIFTFGELARFFVDHGLN
jgi:hypothetical protein